MSMNLHVEAVCGKEREEFGLFQTQTPVSYAAIAKGANPYQVYAESLQVIDDKDMVKDHLAALRLFLEKHKNVQINWYVW